MIPSWSDIGHLGRGCGLYAWLSPTPPGSLGAASVLDLANRVWKVWGVVEAWGRVVEHEHGLRALFMRPIALSPCYGTANLAAKLADLYDVPVLGSVGEVQRLYPPLTTGALS